MMEEGLFWPGIAVVIAVITFLSLNQRQRDIILTRLHLKGRRASSANTPPRSVSPDGQNKKSLASALSDIATTFPPTQRDQLVKLSLSNKQREALGNGDFDPNSFHQNLLEFEEDYVKADSQKYCYSGFSVQEIKALGDFPDYATLSEVPLPNAYKEFNIDKAIARPYRPLRWAYHQTMSLTKLETDWWLELENTYKDRIAQRKELYAQHGKSVVQWLPGSELACKELMEMILQFLCARYPQYFVLSSDNQVFENKILGTEQVIKEKHPLLVLLDNVPEDFALMLRNPDTGYYHFRAGMICSALGWSVETKMGMQLHEIHAPIPDYREKMQFSMDRFFTKMPSFKPIQRGSWGLEVDQPLFMPAGHPHEKYRESQAADVTLDRCHLRVDWQTLRRLPLSGSIVFNFKAVFTPVTEFRHEPYIPSLILKIIHEGKKNLMEYKNTWHTEHVVIPALEEYEKEQRENGMIVKNWEVETLEQSPFFPGWEKRWHEAQGF